MLSFGGLVVQLLHEVVCIYSNDLKRSHKGHLHRTNGSDINSGDQGLGTKVKPWMKGDGVGRAGPRVSTECNMSKCLKG